MILGLFKISGHSMLPNLKPSDVVLISTLPYFIFSPKIGDVIVFKKEEKSIVKRIPKILGDKIYVEGDNKGDSLDTGWIYKRDIIGKVLFRI